MYAIVRVYTDNLGWHRSPMLQWGKFESWDAAQSHLQTLRKHERTGKEGMFSRFEIEKLDDLAAVA